MLARGGLPVVVAAFIVEIVLDEVRRRTGSMSRGGKILDWVREVATPPPGVELVASDGSLFTGLIVVDRNRPVVVLAARQMPASRPTPPSPPLHQSPYNPPYGGSTYGSSNTAMQRLYDEEEEARRGESPPFWRR